MKYAKKIVGLLIPVVVVSTLTLLLNKAMAGTGSGTTSMDSIELKDPIG